VFRFRFGPDAAAVFVNDALHRSESDSGAFKLLGCMQPLKNSEKFIGVFHVEANAVVTNHDHSFVPAFQLRNFDDSRFAVASKFHGVGEQIHEHLFQKIGVALDERQRADSPGNISPFEINLQFIARNIHQFAEGNALGDKALAGKARKIQQSINEQTHIVDGLLNAIQAMRGFGFEFGAEIFQQDFREAVNVAKRRAKVVRDGIAERLQFLIRGLQLCSALNDALFQN